MKFHSENTKITENSLTMATNDNLGRFMALMSEEKYRRRYR